MSTQHDKHFGSYPRMTYVQASAPAFDIKGCAAWATLVFQATLVVLLLVILVVYTEHQDKVYVLQNSVRSLSVSAERAVNISTEVRRNMPPVNWTSVLNKSIAHDEESWVNATINAKKTIRSVENMVQKASETGAVEKYTELATTITRILASPKVAQDIEVFSGHAKWMFAALKSDTANSAFKVIKESVRDIADTIKSEETKRVVDNFLHENETLGLVSELKSLVADARNTIQFGNGLIEQAHHSGMIRHLSDILGQIKDENIPKKAGHVFEQVEEAESWVSTYVKEGFNFVSTFIENKLEHHNRQNREIRQKKGHDNLIRELNKGTRHNRAVRNNNPPPQIKDDQ